LTRLAVATSAAFGGFLFLHPWLFGVRPC